jgi:CheY-like chemotaxis protein
VQSVFPRQDEPHDKHQPHTAIFYPFPYRPVPACNRTGHGKAPDANRLAAPLVARRVLVVDDDEDSRDALQMLLTWAGYEVQTACNGAEGLTTAKNFRPQFIFLDISMPEMNGYEVCRSLRLGGLFRDTRIYALSALTGTEHDTRCSEAGFTAQFIKPLDPAILDRLP